MSGFSEAGYRAVTTIAFISPEAVLPRVMEQLLADINADGINSLTDEDLAIWATPEGTTYVDGRYIRYHSVQFVEAISQFWPRKP